MKNHKFCVEQYGYADTTYRGFKFGTFLPNSLLLYNNSEHIT